MQSCTRYRASRSEGLPLEFASCLENETTAEVLLPVSRDVARSFEDEHGVRYEAVGPGEFDPNLFVDHATRAAEKHAPAWHSCEVGPEVAGDAWGRSHEAASVLEGRISMPRNTRLARLFVEQAIAWFRARYGFSFEHAAKLVEARLDGSFDVQSIDPANIDRWLRGTWGDLAAEVEARHVASLAERQKRATLEKKQIEDDARRVTKTCKELGIHVVRAELFTVPDQTHWNSPGHGIHVFQVFLRDEAPFPIPAKKIGPYEWLGDDAVPPLTERELRGMKRRTGFSDLIKFARAGFDRGPCSIERTDLDVHGVIAVERGRAIAAPLVAKMGLHEPAIIVAGGYAGGKSLNSWLTSEPAALTAINVMARGLSLKSSIVAQLMISLAREEAYRLGISFPKDAAFDRDAIEAKIEAVRRGESAHVMCSPDELWSEPTETELDAAFLANPRLDPWRSVLARFSSRKVVKNAEIETALAEAGEKPEAKPSHWRRIHQFFTRAGFRKKNASEHGKAAKAFVREGLEVDAEIAGEPETAA